mmetsp:Transcript_54008/g.123084  ORF Transcript_54008/g.123084 Transcript_54008/m.123084 type:complete len:275 (-) Transcript_54008:1979-2803(-)
MNMWHRLSSTRKIGTPKTTVSKMYAPLKNMTRQASEMCLPHLRPMATSSSWTSSPLEPGLGRSRRRPRLSAASTRCPPRVVWPWASQPTMRAMLAKQGIVSATTALLKISLWCWPPLLSLATFLACAPVAPLSSWLSPPPLAAPLTAAPPSLTESRRFVKMRSSVSVWCVATTATEDGSQGRKPDRLQKMWSLPFRRSFSRWYCMTMLPISVCMAPSSEPPTRTKTLSLRRWQSRAVALRDGNVCPDWLTMSTTVCFSHKLLRLRLPLLSRLEK